MSEQKTGVFRATLNPFNGGSNAIRCHPSKGDCTVILDHAKIRLPAMATTQYPEAFDELDVIRAHGFNDCLSQIKEELARLGIPFVQEGEA